ncbi:MAG: hypothetical protein IT276_03680 [Ignavibacteriaceae bacterium]|nr:hypothetical protein [Ignavibacterium sp.]MCC6253986.1 hypothetical protein [Ignavibacteriaceae bacterium]HMN24922.1 hypothetical protein [Ignavibacteriaceae bacterium]HRN26893.1 hypothetical protein [Ignavibacteriaceae bacterium]HRP92426.1 hypothetical protein [Ignavibacteriaceae bacterium]
MKIKILLPQNIFSHILLSELNLNESVSVEFHPSALIAKKLSEDENSIGLIPTLDLLSFKDFFVSSKIGVSFNALLSNSYIHFKEGQETLEQIFLKGDVTTNEIILSKILFKEFYDVNVTPALVKDDTSHIDDNMLIVGDENYVKELFFNGLSFAEEIIELLDAPYVNFILAGTSENVLKDFQEKYRDNLMNGHTEDYSSLLKEFTQTSLDFISVNIQHIVFDLEDQDLEGIKTLMQLPYYHGIIKDMMDIKFV